MISTAEADECKDVSGFAVILVEPRACFACAVHVVLSLLKGVDLGQAAVEFPEPTQQNSAPSSASADDLLSQLAGEEIDRLLAEAESEEPAKEPPPAPAGIADAVGDAVASPVLPEPPAAAVDVGVGVAPAGEAVTIDTEPPTEPVAPSADQSPEKTSIADNVVAPDAQQGVSQPETEQPAAVEVEPAQGQLDALFNELTSEASTTDPAPQADSMELHGHFDGVAPQPEGTAHSALEGELSEALAGGVEGAPVDPAAAASLEAELMASLDPANAAPPAPKPADASSLGGGKPGMLVGALELLNKPFASLPLDTRDLLGKVAIVTAFNAVVILVYVIVFRG